MVKMVVVVRTDLGLGPGAIATQVAHASMRWLTERIKAWRWEDWGSGSGEGSVMTEEEDEWVLGTFTKIVLQVNTKDDLEAIQEAALVAGLTCWPVHESGIEGKMTAIGIGPHEAERIDPITRKLKLLR